MLRKALGELGRVSRTKRTVTLVGILLLLVGLITVGVVLADPTIDGDITDSEGWGDPVATDPNEVYDPGPPVVGTRDQYDINGVYMRSSDDNLTFFGGFDVYAGSITLNTLASISFGFDTDANSATGGSVDGGVCPNVGADYRHDYLRNFLGGIDQALLRWNKDVSDWEFQSSALGVHSPDYEIAVEYYALGMTETECISVAVYFENRVEDSDDYVCDMTWCYTDGITAVDLSSFTAGSEGADGPAMQPGMLALLGLGVGLAAAGGVVLWRGRSLAG